MNKVLLYHITDIDNLYSMAVALGALLSHNQMKNAAASFSDISHQNIQDRRAKKEIAYSPYGTLHDYVPFFFAAAPPMLCAIRHGKVPQYQKSQQRIVHLVTSLEAIQSAGCDYVFTDGHAEMALSNFYKDLNDLDKVDWDVMKAKYWKDTTDDPSRKRRRQAEFLVYQSVPWTCIQGIGVMTSEIKDEIDKIFENISHKSNVKEIPKWYY